MKSLSRSTSRGKLRLARRFLVRQGVTPIPGGGVILPDGAVAVPLVDGTVIYVDFTPVTTTHCHWATSSPWVEEAVVANAKVDRRREVKQALETLLSFMSVANSASSTTHEQPFQYAAE